MFLGTVRLCTEDDEAKELVVSIMWLTRLDA